MHWGHCIGMKWLGGGDCQALLGDQHSSHEPQKGSSPSSATRALMPPPPSSSVPKAPPPPPPPPPPRLPARPRGPGPPSTSPMATASEPPSQEPCSAQQSGGPGEAASCQTSHESVPSPEGTGPGTPEPDSSKAPQPEPLTTRKLPRSCHVGPSQAEPQLQAMGGSAALNSLLPNRDATADLPPTLPGSGAPLPPKGLVIATNRRDDSEALPAEPAAESCRREKADEGGGAPASTCHSAGGGREGDVGHDLRPRRLYFPEYCPVIALLLRVLPLHFPHAPGACVCEIMCACVERCMVW